MGYLVISDDEQFLTWMRTLLPQHVMYQRNVANVIEIDGMSPLDLQLIIWHEKTMTDDAYEQCKQIHQLQVPILYFTSQFQPAIQPLLPYVFDFFIEPYKDPYIVAKIKSAERYYENIQQLEQQARFLEKDLLVAKNVQKSALTPSLHKRSIQLDGFYVTSNVLGGDMYCWFEVSPHQTAIILYDVMGHGVASSLVTMSIRSLLRGMMTRLADPNLVVQELNRHINELYKDEYMDSYLVTAIYLLIDTEKNTLQYVNAGHPEGYLFQRDGTVVTLHANAPILGLLPSLKFSKTELCLQEHQRIILYTDGLQQEDESIEPHQFIPYSAGGNAEDLQQFVAKKQLENVQQLDDISLVFITVSKKEGVS